MNQNRLNRPRLHEWNALLVTLIALVAVAPVAEAFGSVPVMPAALPAGYAVLCWLRSGNGAQAVGSTVDGVHAAQISALLASLSGLARPTSQVGAPVQASAVFPVLSSPQLRAASGSDSSRPLAPAALQPHEAAFLAGARTNQNLE